MVQDSTSEEGSGTGEYTITRTFTVTDDAGNSTTDVQIITVIDTTAPEFTYVPAPATYECSEFDAIGGVVRENGRCDGQLWQLWFVIRERVHATDALGNYTVTRTFTVIDDAGNQHCGSGDHRGRHHSS